MSKLKLFPVEFEVYIEGDDELQAKFTAFDDESLMVKIDGKIMCPDTLKQIAELFETASDMLKHGVKDD